MHVAATLFRACCFTVCLKSYIQSVGSPVEQFQPQQLVMASNSTTILTTTEPTYTIAAPTSTFLSDDPVASRTSYISSTITTLIVCIIPMVALTYLFLVSWAYRYSRKNPRPLNKGYAVRVYRYAPWAYVFLVILSLVELAFSSWLVLQYRFHHNYPTVGFRAGVRLLLFASCWTTFTAGTYTLLFLHPVWSKHPVASIGAQAVWIFFTWLFWVVGSALVNTLASTLTSSAMCRAVAYCAQIRGLFAVAILESLTLIASMIAVMWLAWQSFRLAPEQAPIAMQ